MSLSKNILWRVRLFDGPRLESPEGVTITRFKSQRVGALLTYLSLRLGHPCAREELMYALWPEEDNTRVTANRLRVALSSLRSQMEPPGTPFGSALDVSHPGCIRLRSETVWCDVTAIDEALKMGHPEEAIHLLQGEFLPDYYEDWAILHQQRFNTLRENLADTLFAAEALLPAEKGYHKPSASALFPHAPLYPLPLYLTTFHGRDAERERLIECFYKNRLVTIIGSGGIGKTRFAVEFAHQMRTPTVFVSLADIEDGNYIPRLILQALHILPDAHNDLMEQVTGSLGRRGSPLLILDNAEHLLEAVATLTMHLLESLPDLQILITSRQRLEIMGEALFSLSPLQSPGSNLPYDVLIEIPAVALFLERARSVRPDFTLSDRYIPDVLRICRLLEGVPLALELAAARVTQQTLAGIAADLANNLMTLKSRQRGLSKRHQSLRATLQGSIDLLVPKQKEFFAALSVFQGGWTAEAARAVTQSVETEMFLEDLLVRSLVVAKEDSERGTIRYSFLETIRQFATELLSLEQRSPLLSHHSAYFLTLAADVWEDDIRKLLPLDEETENLQIALERGWAQQDTAFWHGLIGALCYMFVRGRHRAALPWVERGCAQVSQIPEPVLRTRLRDITLRFRQDLGWADEARKIGREMQADGRARGDLITENLAAIRLSIVETETEDAEKNLKRIVRIQQEVLQVVRSLADPLLLKITLCMTARSLNELAEISDAEHRRQLSEEALTLGKECHTMLSPHSRFLSLVELILFISHNSLKHTAKAYAALKDCQKTALSQNIPSVLMSAFYFESIEALRNGKYAYAALLHGALLDIQETLNFNKSDFLVSINMFRSEMLQRLDPEMFETFVQLGRRIPLPILVDSSLDSPPALLAEETAHTR